MPKVEFHFDFGSPNAYLAHLVIPEIEERTGAKFEYVPVLLGGVYKLTGNRSPAESLGVSERYVDEIYRHMWAEPKKLDDPAVLRAALVESGFDADRFSELVQYPEIKARLRENTERSVARGTFGSPTFLVGDEMFFGKDRLRDVEELIRGARRPDPCGSKMAVMLKRFEEPDEVRIFEKGRFEIVRLDGMTIGRATYEPGWRWSLHVGRDTGAVSCPVEHVGIVVSGRATAAMDGGTITELRPGDVFHIAPGHDSWVVGDEPYVSLHFLGADHYAERS